jgi:hypothetical protein
LRYAPIGAFWTHFRPIEGRWLRHSVKKKYSKIRFLSLPWVAVLKLFLKKNWFPTEKKVAYRCYTWLSIIALLKSFSSLKKEEFFENIL